MPSWSRAAASPGSSVSPRPCSADRRDANRRTTGTLLRHSSPDQRPPMPVPFPRAADALQRPPDRAEAELIARGIRSASMPSAGLTALQQVLIRAITRSMTGFDIDPNDLADISAAEFA